MKKQDTAKHRRACGLSGVGLLFRMSYPFLQSGLFVPPGQTKAGQEFCDGGFPVNGDHSKEIVMLSGVKRAGHIAIKELKKAVARK